VNAATTGKHAAKTHSAVGNSSTRCAKRNRATGTFKYSDWQFPDTLNPYQTTEAVSEENINGMLEGMYRFDNHAKLIPIIATNIPTIKNGSVKDGGKLITFRFKKGLKWSNSQEITSKNLAFGWHVDMDKLTGPACSGSCDVISRIDTPDKYTAVLHLKKIYAPAISSASASAIPDIWPSKWAGAYNNDPHAAAQWLEDPKNNFENGSFPTNGAYQVSDFVKDDRITLHPMKYYDITTCGGYVSSMIFAFYSSKPAMIAAAAAKQTDVTQNYTVADIPALQQQSGFKLHEDPGFIIEHLELNVDSQYHGSANPVANTKVRQAMALAINKIALIQSALGVSSSAAKGVTAWTFLVNTKQLVQPFADKKLTGQWDPLYKPKGAKKAGAYINPGSSRAVADARKLLSQSPYASGFSVDFATTRGNPVRAAAESVIAQEWNGLGIKVNANLVPASTLFADWDHNGTLDHGDFQVGMFAYVGAPDPDGFKFNMQCKYIDRKAAVHASINSNNAGICNSAIDKAYDAGAGTFDLKKRAAAYAVVQSLVNQNAFWIPLYFRPTIATDSGRITNFSNNPTAAGPEWNTFSWKSKSG